MSWIWPACSVADPDSGSGIRSFFDPWVRVPGSGMGKKSRFGTPDKQIPDHISESLVTFGGLKILKLFVTYPYPVSGAFLILDPGWKNSDSGYTFRQCAEPLLFFTVLVATFDKLRFRLRFWLRI
jgi:hypothetical protein